MLVDIICARCDGRGHITYFEENRTWSEQCNMCNGTGKLGNIDIDDIDMVTITREKYNELLKYKDMYERVTVKLDNIYEEYKRYCKEYLGCSVKDNRRDLVYYTKLVQDFDKLCDQLRDYCDELSKKVKDVDEHGNVPFVVTDFWYKYVFVDDGGFVTCQNSGMKKELVKQSTYYRWQKLGTLYGVSRYSFVTITNMEAKGFIDVHMRTIYSRMFELVILQRASILRFSGEVTKVSALKEGHDKELARRIRSLYREYIRFINQIYFQSVTVQDQGIELYDML